MFSFIDTGWTQDHVGLRCLKTHSDIFAPLSKPGQVLTDPHVNASFQKSAIRSLATPHNLRALPQCPSLCQDKRIRSTLPSNLEDALTQIKDLQNVLTKAEADVTISREELRQYMARDKPVLKSRKVLSHARYISHKIE